MKTAMCWYEDIEEVKTSDNFTASLGTLYLTYRGMLMLTLFARESSADDRPKFFYYFFSRKFSNLSHSDSE